MQGTMEKEARKRFWNLEFGIWSLVKAKCDRWPRVEFFFGIFPPLRKTVKEPQTLSLLLHVGF